MLTLLAFATLATLGPQSAQVPADPVPVESAVDRDPWFAGGVFEAQIAPGFEVTETGSGQVHFFEVRRTGDPRDQAFPALKLLCAPGAAASVTVPEFADLLAGNVGEYAASLSMELGPTENLELVIGGVARRGQRFQLNSPGAGSAQGLKIDVLVYQSGENLIGVIEKADLLGDEGTRSMAQQVYSTLKVKPVTIASARLVQVGNFTVEVPVISRTAWNRPDGAAFLRIGVGGGNFELGAQEGLTEQQAQVIGSSYLMARQQALQESVKELGGTTLDTRWAGEWIQNGQVRGFHMDFVQSDGAAFTISNFYLLAGTDFFTATVTVPTVELPIALPRFRDMLESLQCPGNEDALRASFGRTSLNQAHGLTLYYPDTLRLEEELADVTRLTLRGLDNLFPSDLAMHLFVDPSPLPSGGLEAFVLETIEAQFPGAEIGQASAIEGNLLGKREPGFQWTWTFDGKSSLATALSAPLHGGTLIALATSRLENGGSSSWSFANILAGMQRLDPGDRWIQSKTYDVIFDPATWTVNSSHVGTGSQLRFKNERGSLQVTFQDATSPLGINTESPFEDLVDASNPYFEIQETYAGTAVTGERSQVFEVLAQHRDAIDINGVTCIRKRLHFALPSGEAYVLFLYYMLTEQRAVVAHFWAKADDKESLEAGQKLVETLRIRAGLGVIEQVQVLGDLRIDLPLGFVRDTPDSAGPESLYFWNSLVEGTFAAVVRIPSKGLPEYQELWKGAESSIRAGVAPGLLEGLTTEVGELSFLGHRREARIYQYTPLDSDQQQVQLKSIAQAGPWTYELTLVGPLESQYEFDKLRAVLEGATQVPTWQQVSEQGYNIAFDPARASLSRQGLPNSPMAGFLIKEAGIEKLYSVTDGQWTFSGPDDAAFSRGITSTLTSQFDLGATKSFDLELETTKLRFQSSTNTLKKLGQDGVSFSNQTPGEGLYIAVKLLGSASAPEVLMDQSVLNDGAYSIEDFHLVERDVLGARVTGHMATFVDKGGVRYANQKYVVPVPGGALELFATWAPSAQDLGLTQVNLFFDSLELVQ